VSEFKQKVLTAAVDRYVLTPTQCMMLRQDAQVIGMKRAPVLSKDGVTRTVSRTRTCTSCWVPFAPHYKWLYSIINELTMAINAEHYRFDVTGVQQLQILRYSPLQRFSWHWDTFTGSDRKLTAVVNLSAPTEYLGGGLQVKGRHRQRALYPRAGGWVLVPILRRTSCACAYLWYTLGVGCLVNRTSLAMTHAANLPRHQYVSVDKSIL
jgi:hypothetical protein